MAQRSKLERRILLTIWTILVFVGGGITALVLKQHFADREFAARIANDLLRVTGQRNALARGDMKSLQKQLDEAALWRSDALKGLYQGDPGTLDGGAMDSLQIARYSYDDDALQGQMRGLLNWVPPDEEQAARNAFEKQYVKTASPAPELAVQKWLGKPLPLESLRGKVVLIDFWATWCAACIAGLPHMQALYEKYKDQGFEIIAVHIPPRSETAEAFLKGKPYTFTFALGTQQVRSDYGINAAPTHCLIARDGRVFWAPNPWHPNYRSMELEQYEAEMSAAIERALGETARQ